MNTPVRPPPPSSSGPVPQATPAPASGTGTLVQLPPNLPPLESGQSLAATVIARSAPGQFQVQLESGAQITVQTALTLASGSTLTLQVQTLGQPPQVAILLGGDGAFAPGGQGQAPAGGPLPGGTPAPIVAADTTTLTQGAIVTATVTRVAVAAAGQGAAATPGQAATGATGAPTATAAGAAVGAAATATPATGAPQAAAAGIVTPGAGATTPAAGTAAGSQTTAQSGPRIGAQAGPATGGATGAAQATAPTALPQGTTVAVRLLAIVPPGGSTPSAGAHSGGTPGTAAGAQILTGTVSGANTAGQTVVQTPIGVLTLSADNALPVGSRVTLSFAGAPQLPVQAGYESVPIGLNQQWDTLRQAVNALQQNDPAAARTLIQQVLPQPGAQLTSSTLFFLAALMGGDLRRWIGDEASRAIERGGLLGRLEEEFGRVRGLSSEAGAQDWRTYLIPLMSGSGMDQIKLFVRDDPGENEDGQAEQEPGTRFVIEVEFSNLGPFQFDGLTRGKNIDLIVRTQQALSDEMRRDINRVYANTISALGFAGEIAFQITPAFELNPLHEIGGDTMGMTV